MTEAAMPSRRLAVYTDYAYTVRNGEVYAERAFALFMMAVLAHATESTVIGRLQASGGQARYRLPDDARFVALPYYADGSRPSSVLKAFIISFRRLWRSLDAVDVAWVLGPHGLAIPFALLVLARRRRLRLGVRQDLRAYARRRHPERRLVHGLADILESLYRALARRYPVVVVGEELGHSYRRSRAVLAASVSLVSHADIVPPASAVGREWTNRFTVLSVGRLDAEKNPFLLVDIIGALVQSDSRWQLVVCGEGPLQPALAERVAERQLGPHVRIRGYVPFAELREVYRSSHVFLHVSLTEGLPQVLFEAFAAGLPVVATDVGGVRAAVDGAAMLVAPDRAAEAVHALTCLQRSPHRRAELVRAGGRVAADHTLEREAARVATFLLDGSRSADEHAARRFLSRLPALDVSGRRVLDIRWRDGEICRLLADEGAREVVGVSPQDLAAAGTDGRYEAPYDIVLSRGALDRAADADTHIAQLRAAAAPDGMIAIEFSPRPRRRARRPADGLTLERFADVMARSRLHCTWYRAHHGSPVMRTTIVSLWRQPDDGR